MKSRLFVVDANSYTQTITSGVASIICPALTGKEWLKTVSDIMADMLQIEIGDYIFLWQMKDGAQKSRIFGVYRAISKPYYDPTIAPTNAPFRIKIEEAYHFDNPIDEYDFLNCPYIKDNLWTIIGKKVAGKKRGTSPLSLEESKHLITLLIGVNPHWTFNPFNITRTVIVPNNIYVDYRKKGKNAVAPSLATMVPNNLNFLKPKGGLYYEKTLETIFNQEASSRNGAFYNLIGINIEKVIWFSNYLPYSIEQSEMDYLVIESEDGINYTKIFVIDFMREKIDEDHIHRILLYSKWVNDTIGLGTDVVEPMIICKQSPDFIGTETDAGLAAMLPTLSTAISNDQLKYGVKPLKIFTYDFAGLTPNFTRKK